MRITNWIRERDGSEQNNQNVYAAQTKHILITKEQLMLFINVGGQMLILNHVALI